MLEELEICCGFARELNNVFAASKFRESLLPILEAAVYECLERRDVHRAAGFLLCPVTQQGELGADSLAATRRGGDEDVAVRAIQ